MSGEASDSSPDLTVMSWSWPSTLMVATPASAEAKSGGSWLLPASGGASLVRLMLFDPTQPPSFQPVSGWVAPFMFRLVWHCPACEPGCSTSLSCPHRGSQAWAGWTVVWSKQTGPQPLASHWGTSAGLSISRQRVGVPFWSDFHTAQLTAETSHQALSSDGGSLTPSTENLQPPR